MDCTYCRTKCFKARQNGMHIEIVCCDCHKHIKFVSKKEFDSLHLPLTIKKSKPLYEEEKQ